MSKQKHNNENYPLLSSPEDIKKCEFSTYNSTTLKSCSVENDIQLPDFLSLDFDRVVNSYNIQSTKEKYYTRNKIENTKYSKKWGLEDKVIGSDTNYPMGQNQPEKQNHLITGAGNKAIRWILTCLVGLLTGLTAILIVFCVERLVDFRVSRLNRQLQWATGHTTDDEIRYWYHNVRFFDLIARDFKMKEVYLSYIVFNLVLVLSCTCFCVLVSPSATGSGIPEVKAYLNGIHVHNFADLKLFLVKLIGTILAVSSGLVVGPEGPIVHLGAIIGASLTSTFGDDIKLREFNQEIPIQNKMKKETTCTMGWTRKIFSFIQFHLSNFRNDLEIRNLISIGAAAGFASAFGAPIGGLLYSLEEASSFFSHDMLWKTLTATAIATFCMAVYYGDLTRYSMLSLEIIENKDSNLTRIQVVPLYMVIGCCGGIIGAIFNNTYAFMNYKRKAFYDVILNKTNTHLFFKLLESALICILTSVSMLTLAINADWACKSIKGAEDSFDHGFLHRYNCPPRQINEIGSLLFGSREESIRDILTNPDEFEPETLLAVGVLFLGLMMITFGVALPTGMFMPTVLTGASLGGYAGLIFKSKFPGVHAADFALIGAAAFLAGMQRNTVSLCVILMEGTGQTRVLIPVIITVVCARTVGDFLSEGIYEIGMELKGYPFLIHYTKTHYDMFTATDVMNKNYHCICDIENVDEIETLLLCSLQQIFPVISQETKEYRGIIHRDQLVTALRSKKYLENMPLQTEQNNGSLFEMEKMDQYNERYEISPYNRDDILESFDGNKMLARMEDTMHYGNCKNSKTCEDELDKNVIVNILQDEKVKCVDVGSLMNRAAFTVLTDCPLSRAYDLFVSMGLSHLPVIGRRGQVVGIISRQCLLEHNVEAKTGFKLT